MPLAGVDPWAHMPFQRAMAEEAGAGTTAHARRWLAGRGRALGGDFAVPGDKSVSHRAVMLAALADGESRIEGFLEGEDTRATATIFEAMGVRIHAPSASRRSVQGVGIDGLQPPAGVLDCGNSGTAMRLLAGLLAGQRFDTGLAGDASLSRRPMRRIIAPLHSMGARIGSADGQRPPLRIQGRQALVGIDFDSPVASAQVKSAVLLAGLYARGETCVREPHPTRDYTERMLASYGWPIAFAPGWARLEGGHRLRARTIDVPGDFSSAAFFLVAATLVPGSQVLLRGVGVDPRRTGLLEALRAMGADIREHARREGDCGPVADLEVRHARLRGIDLPETLVPDMIDEFPVFAVAAAAASGVTRIAGAAELRVKESDRIAAMATGLRALGVRVHETADGMVVEGGPMRAGAIDSLGDHRIAMAFAVAAQLAEGEVVIEDVANWPRPSPASTHLPAQPVSACARADRPGSAVHAERHRDLDLGGDPGLVAHRRLEGPLAHGLHRGAIEFARAAAAHHLHVDWLAIGADPGAHHDRSFLAGAVGRDRIVRLHLDPRRGFAIRAGARTACGCLSCLPRLLLAGAACVVVGAFAFGRGILAIADLDGRWRCGLGRGVDAGALAVDEPAKSQQGQQQHDPQQRGRGPARGLAAPRRRLGGRRVRVAVGHGVLLLCGCSRQSLPQAGLKPRVGPCASAPAVETDGHVHRARHRCAALHGGAEAPAPHAGNGRAVEVPGTAARRHLDPFRRATRIDVHAQQDFA